MSEPLPVHVIEDPEHAASVLHPLRRRILAALEEPESSTTIARRLSLPRQKVNYHLRELERLKLVHHIEDRRRGNCIERIVQATARHYLISPAALGDDLTTAEEARDRFSWSYLIALAARTVRDLAILARRAASAKKRLPTFALQTEVRFANAADQNAFVEALSAEVARLAAEYHDEHAPGGRRFTFIVGGYPTITRSEHTDEAAAKESR